MPVDQQLRNENSAQLFLMSKSIEARERVLIRVRETLANDFPALRIVRDSGQLRWAPADWELGG